MSAIERARELATEVRDFEQRSVETKGRPANFIDIVARVS